jgi:hypothetical protein
MNWRAATMDVRFVVGGLLCRNAELSQLLSNYACRLDRGCSGRCTASPPCFIVPNWTADQPPVSPSGSRLLTVQAHTPRSDPGRHETLDAIMRLVHAVLTDDHARSSITAQRLSPPVDLVASNLGTVGKLGIWTIAPVPSSDSDAAHRRLLPWPDCNASVVASGALAAGAFGMN